MKTFSILFLILLAASLQAQDTLFRRDASVEIVKVTEINPETIKYKRFQNPQGPDYAVYKKEIRMVAYANGIREVFDIPVEVRPAIAMEKLSYSNSIFYLGSRPLSRDDFDDINILHPVRSWACRTMLNNRLCKTFGINGAAPLFVGTAVVLIGGFAYLLSGGDDGPVNNILRFAEFNLMLGASLEIASIASVFMRHAHAKKATRLYNASLLL